MTKEELEMLTEEEREAYENTEIVFKCKPTYNFQSIEFEYKVNPFYGLNELFDVYKAVLEGLTELAPDQPGQMVKEVGEPATEKQLEILKKFKIPYRKGVTKQEAQKLISDSMKK